MDKHLSYLIINLLVLFFPILLSFDKRVQFYRSWKSILPGLIVTGAIFLIWDYIFTIYDVWSFNKQYILGVYFLNLPLEEILFFVTVPFACLFIYSCLNHYIKKDILSKISSWISILLVALSAVMLIFYPQKVYTLITFGLLLVLIAFAQYFRKAKYLSRFYFAYTVSLVPFYIVNGILTSVPIVNYNDQENIGLRIGTIPLEDHFYSLSMLLMNVMFFEYFKRKELR
jgi:lycopene cyclase domain-containing protein